MPNRLADETSPYLRQHRNNPVDWYPWGPAALERSRREDKPIFLSIGYSACHWCHVMEHESFEDEAMAAKLNEAFVCIKVDREERPDLDQIYMNAVQMLTGRGGWPMSVFLTPEGKPFYGGTYWPPTARGGMPGFDEIIAAVSQAWQNRRDVALAGADQLTEELQKVGNFFSTAGELNRHLLDASEATLRRAFDSTSGGFGGAPKFPHPLQLRVLLRQWRHTGHAATLDMVRVTLDKMASGGIYDHLGGGFARYSVDARWLVPHFEKMLYDNALLAGAYLEGYLATGDPEYARVTRETLDYVLRDMTDPAGGFYSSEDADSEGVEGKFYVWTPAQLREVLGDKAAATFARVYDVTDEGNFEGANILNRSKTLDQNAAILGRDEHELAEELAASRAKLLSARSGRVRPGRDDKVLVSWNALVIDSLARAGAALGEPRYVEAAVKGTDFILDQLSTSEGRLLHTWRGGVAKLAAYLDDYAGMAVALVSVYEATFDEHFLDEAIRLAELVLQRFGDTKEGGFFYTASDHEPLIARTKDLTDSSLPSGSGLAATALVLLGKLTGRADLAEAAVATMQSAVGVMRQSPLAAGQMLLALDLYLGPSYEVAIVGDAEKADTQAVLDDLRGRFLPNKVVAWRPTASTGGATAHHSAALDMLFTGRESKDGTPTAYVCQDSVCQEPIVGKDAIVAEWDRLAKSQTSR